MSLYPKNIEHKIGFDEIRHFISDKCCCDLGKQKINNMAFLTDADEIKASLHQTMEMTEIIRTNDDFPTPSFATIYDAITRIRPEGTYLTTNELHTLRKSI
ncbi:MAG: endonuclease MutS2, partial [Bacteroidales bacterium]|nr:endonuclease MutS2 [Bacteroidales bacterium]